MFDLKNNQLIIMKSRKIEYEVRAKNQKVFLVFMRIGGPKGNEF